MPTYVALNRSHVLRVVLRLLITLCRQRFTWVSNSPAGDIGTLVLHHILRGVEPTLPQCALVRSQNGIWQSYPDPAKPVTLRATDRRLDDFIEDLQVN